MGKTEGATVIERIDHLIAKIMCERADIRCKIYHPSDFGEYTKEERPGRIARHFELGMRLMQLHTIKAK